LAKKNKSSQHMRHMQVIQSRTLRQLHGAFHGAYENGGHVIFGGDLNLQIDVGKRGAQFASLCSEIGLVIANDDDHHDPSVDTWTFCNSMGTKRCIDFVFGHVRMTRT